MQLKTDLQTMKKGSDSIDKYLQRIKHARDQLNSVNVQMLEEDIVVVVTTDVLTGHPTMPAGITVKKSSNVSTMKILKVSYIWVDAEGNKHSMPVEFGKKNYLPFSHKMVEGKDTLDAGKFEVVVDESIKGLINDKTTVELSNMFDNATGFTYLKAYIRNADGTLAAGMVTRYMFVTK